jgi:hypothetical protein
VIHFAVEGEEIEDLALKSEESEDLSWKCEEVKIKLNKVKNAKIYWPLSLKSEDGCHPIKGPTVQEHLVVFTLPH